MDIEIHSLIVGDTKNPKGFAIKNPNILLMWCNTLGFDFFKGKNKYAVQKNKCVKMG
jgi:hypothetical protein